MHDHVPMTTALGQLYAEMSPVRRRHFHGVIALMLLGAVAELAALGSIIPFITLLAHPEAMQQMTPLPQLFALLGAHTRHDMLVTTVALFGMMLVLAAAIRLQLAWSSQGLVFKFGHDIAVSIQHRILSQPYTYHISQNTSVVLSSLEKVQVLIFNVLLQVMQAAISAIIAVFIVAALVAVNPFAALVSAAGFGAMYVVVTLFTNRALALNSAVIGASYAERVQIIQESLGGIRDIIIDNSQPVYLEAFRTIDDRFVRAKATTAFIGAAPRFVIEAAGMALLAALALIVSQREGGITAALPTLVAMALGAQRLLPLIQLVYYGWTSLASNRAVFADVLDLLSLPVAPETQVPQRDLAPLPFEREIRFRNVTFNYVTRVEPAVADIDLVIPRGARVAFIGTTGGGKSTMVDLLMGLLEPSAGTVEVDGVPLLGEAQRAWRREVAHVPQAIFLADTSIERNIAFGYPPDEINNARVRIAAAAAELDGFIATLEHGYATRVGERGVQLSGGQRQRLGIARAVYKAARVLVLDEATSALDDATETAVMNSLGNLATQNITVVMVAHRLSTIRDCDLVVRLDGGRIAAAGSYTEIVGPLAST